MTIGSILYTFLLKPLELVFDIIYYNAFKILHNPGLSIIALSLAINLLVLPLYRRADMMQEEERETEARLDRWVRHIKKTFSGDERTMMLQTYYRQNNYSPTYVLRGAVSLFLEIPFFIAAYRFLSGLDLLIGVPFGPIKDLSRPDGLLVIGNITLNILPFIMTVVNFISSGIFAKNSTLKTKIQLYVMAAFFLVFLYNSPSGLVFYWTLNNIFSLVKTIFYKLKNPRKILSVLVGLTGVFIAVIGIKLFISHSVRRASSCTVILIGAALCCVPFFSVFKRRLRIKAHVHDIVPDGKLFCLTAVTLTIMTGLLIPSAIIGASPQEFVDAYHWYNPLLYIVNSFLVAAGVFVLWIGVFYQLSSTRGKIIFERIMFVLCGAALLNYFVYGSRTGNLHSNLAYEDYVPYSTSETLIDVALIAVLVILLLYILINFSKYSSRLVAIVGCAFLAMSVFNCIGINRSINQMNMENTDDMPHVTLSANNNNVVVIMMDRAMSVYVPYIFEERPELKEQFSGFTYYNNTVSFGGFTNFAAPALYGGYEYTPLEINRRSEEPIAVKHDEAIKVMPVIFSENDYDVTVFDPTYAGYDWWSDLSIYDEYENVEAYHTMGRFNPNTDTEYQIENRNRNFFLHSVEKISPLLLQEFIYDNGTYCSSYALANVGKTQTVLSPHKAHGLDYGFMNSYYVLEELPRLTSVEEKDRGTFLMMSNDLTHEPVLLSEADNYSPKPIVDNTEYDQIHSGRFELDGRAISVSSAIQYSYYQSNMAAYIQLGQWLDYLKDCGVYDNTRIIIVSDHGRNLYSLPELIYDVNNGSDPFNDLEYFLPVLMVKDFGSTEFTTSDEFMTNADVPTLAFNGTVSSPTNPFTGKLITDTEKTAHDQYIIASAEMEIAKNNGNTFLPAEWFTVHDSVWDINNWNLIAKDAILP